MLANAPVVSPFAAAPQTACGPEASVPSPALAPHETLELHELLAYKSTGLIQLKKTLPCITCPDLRQLYLEAIRATEQDIRQIMVLLQTYGLPEC